MVLDSSIFCCLQFLSVLFSAVCIWNKWCTDYYTKADSFCYNPRMRDYQVKNQLHSRPLIGQFHPLLASDWLQPPPKIFPGPEIRADQVKKQLVPLGYCKCGVMVQCCSSIATTPDLCVMDTICLFAKIIVYKSRFPCVWVGVI